MRWADSDSDDNSDDEQHIPIQHSGLNDGSIPDANVFTQVGGSNAVMPVSAMMNVQDGVAGEEDDANNAGKDDDGNNSDSDQSSSEDETDDEERERRREVIRKAKEDAAAAKASKTKPGLKKNMSKKEKAELKNKELDDLDDLLNEFGVDAAAAPSKDEEQDEDEDDAVLVDAADAAGDGGKKKKEKEEEGKIQGWRRCRGGGRGRRRNQRAGGRCRRPQGEAEEQGQGIDCGRYGR